MATIDSIAATALVQGPIAGMSIAVMRGDDLIVSRGYGFADLEKGVVATADTVYDIASVTKLLTAAAIMRLVDAGRLRLEDDLATRLPVFPNREQGRRITVRHLLSHTSGLHDYEAADTERWLAEGTPLTESFVLDFLRDRPLDFEPGTRWSYSNSGFYLLGLIIQHLTGRDYGRYVREEIALPLGLTDTFVCDQPLALDRRTRGYRPGEGALVPSRLFTPRNIMGDGGLCSTAVDLARLPGALRQRNVLSKAALAGMMQPTELAGGVAVDYGLGVRRGVLAGHPLWGHTGGMRTYWAVLVDYPDDDVIVVVIVNTDGAEADALTIEGRIARAVLDLGEPALRDLPLSQDEIQVYSGLFEDGTSRVRFLGEDSRLRRAAQDSSHPPRSMLHQGNGVFGWSEYPMDRIVFHVAGGRTVGVSEYYNGLFATFRRAVKE